MRLLLIFLSSITLALAQPAPEATLRQLGFLKEGETSESQLKEALRRYQLYKGLETTSTLDAPTRQALAADSAATADAPAAPPPPSDNEDRRFLQQTTPTIPPSSALPTPQDTPTRSTGTPDRYRVFFSHTPFANAPTPLARDTVRRAQKLLAQRGLYRGAIDGDPGVRTRDALLRYQALENLDRSGRLDAQTLSSLGLMPRPGKPIAPLDRSLSGERIYEGRPVPRHRSNGSQRIYEGRPVPLQPR